MKTKIALFILLAVASLGFAQTKEIHFEKSSFAEIKAKAKKENKPVFIDAYTTWCGPCKWMAKNVFTNDTVADYFNAKFVNAKIDMEQGEGPEIAKLYNVRCYPNLLVLDGDGNLLHRAGGAKPTQELIAFAETSFDAEKRFSKYSTEYASKKGDAPFVLNYIDLLSASCLPVDDVLKDYFATQKEENLSSEANWKVISNHVTDYKSKEFNYVLKNINTFKKLYTAEVVDEQIKNVLLESGVNTIFAEGADIEKEYTAFVEDIKKLNCPKTDDVIFNLSLGYYEETKDWAKFEKLVIDQGDNFLKLPQQINSVAWTLYENSDNKTALLKAELWMSKIVDKTVGWYADDTYAAVLYKLKKKKEAKAAAEKAIEKAKKSGAQASDYKETEELLNKIDKL